MPQMKSIIRGISHWALFFLVSGVIIGMTEVLKVGRQIIDANRFEYPTAALWVYGVVFLLYFFACWPISLLARKLEQRWR